jgi:hypothetical protein
VSDDYWDGVEDDWDLSDISAKERLDALLESRYLTTQQAVDGMNALVDERQSTLPHIVIMSALVAKAPGEEPSVWYRSFIGPFPDRPSAVRWAAGWVTGKPRLAFEVTRIETTDEVEASSRNLRRIIEGGL